ncbi:MAG: hypothetical protein JWO81_238 [Alphaproteobacteria bacterium]|nr:hypothetical protein [Alphaproteobacteria bacterium]
MSLRSTSLFLAACALTAASAADAKQFGKVVFNGCVKTRVIKGALCTFVGPYEISSAQPRPSPLKGLGISGNGLRNPLVTTCGGQALTHVQWSYNKMKCPVPVKRD